MRALALSCVMLLGCLPGDERPDPASLLVNVQRSDAVIDGFTTDDGWAVSYDRFVMGLGSMSLEGTDCADYSSSSYDRLYDFTVADTSKVALHYGLGRCAMTVEISLALDDAILMRGVTEGDRVFMREGLGSFAEGTFRLPASVWMKGRASRDGITKEFEWLVRRSAIIRKCFAPHSEDVVSNVDLVGGEALIRELVVRPQEVFRHTPSLDAPIEFGRFAVADVDMDGTVTQEELAHVDIPFDDVLEALRDELPEWLFDTLDVDALGDPTLETLVHQVLSSRIVAFADAGECESGVGFTTSF